MNPPYLVYLNHSIIPQRIAQNADLLAQITSALRLMIFKAAHCEN
jgi:hypothetical protein